MIRAIITVISYILWPLFWIFEQIRDAIGTPSQETFESLSEGVGRPPEPIEGATSDPDPTPGIVLSRVFGGIAAVLVFAIAAFYFFRRFVNRETRTEEVRESLWSEANLLDDLFGGLRGLGDRFRRRGSDQPPDAPIAELYYEVLDHAEGKGQIRALHRTPLQFADALERAYHSPTPKRISEAFSTFRYGGHQPNQAEFNSMRQNWEALKDN